MKPKIAFCYTDWNMNSFREKNKTYGAITYYRCAKPTQYLKEWFDIDLLGAHLKDWGTVEETLRRLFTDYDMVICKHIDNGKMASNFLACAQYFNKPLIVDVDDNYLEIRKDNPAFKTYDKLKGGRYFLGTFMGLSDQLTVSTDPLEQAYTKHFNQFPNRPPITVLPNCNDITDWPTKRKVWNDGKIRIGYQGGKGHGADLELILEPIADILSRFSNAKFEIVGMIEKKNMAKLTKRIQGFRKGIKDNQIEYYGGTPAWDGYPAFLNSFGWDIGLAPLIDDSFNRCKSHIKWMEYSMVGCPTIASKVYPYSEKIQGIDTIIHDKTGLFATSTQEWIKCIEEMIVNKRKRLALAENAYNFIRDNWQYKDHISKWKILIDSHLQKLTDKQLKVYN